MAIYALNDKRLLNWTCGRTGYSASSDDDPVAEGEAAYEAALPWAKHGHGLFHAVGLASNAYERPPNLFSHAFKRAQQDGLHITTHCDFGQKDTHEHIRQAIFEIGVERIDHGLDAHDTEELVQGLLANNIGLTLCPHAYHRRTATEVLFPKLRQLHDRGVRFCINSDDPVYMHDIWIDGNMEKAYQYCKFSKLEMVQLARNAVDMCWADNQEDPESATVVVSCKGRRLHRSSRLRGRAKKALSPLKHAISNQSAKATPGSFLRSPCVQ